VRVAEVAKGALTLTETDPLLLTKVDPLFAHTDVGNVESEEVIAQGEGSSSGYSGAVAETFGARTRASLAGRTQSEGRN
jgi:hypothetical protein